MSRGNTTFKKRDLAVAIEAAKAAGIEVARIEIDKAGKIVIISGTATAEGASGDDDEFDRRIRENIEKERP